MHSSTKWISAFLLGMMVSPACRRSGEPVRSGPSVAFDGGTPSNQPSDAPGIEPDTGAPIGPVANPHTSQYTDGLYGAAPPIAGSGGGGGIAGGGPIAGSGGSGGTGLVSSPRYVVAL